MGSRGPLPEPTAELERRGSRRADTRQSEPVPPPERPVCPRDLSEEAKRIWKRIVPALHKMGVAFKIDSDVLVAYCETLALHDQVAQELAERTTYAVRAQDGKTIKMIRGHPAFQHLMALKAELRQIRREIGLSPAARAALRVTVPSGPRANPGKKQRKGKGRHFGGGRG